MAKRILFAWIEQIVEFDSERERARYIEKTRGVKVLKAFEVDGKYRLRVMKPYNNNDMLPETHWR